MGQSGHDLKILQLEKFHFTTPAIPYSQYINGLKCIGLHYKIDLRLIQGNFKEVYDDTTGSIIKRLLQRIEKIMDCNPAGLLTAFGPLSVDMYLPSLPSLARDLNTSASLAQLSLTACLFGLAFGQLIAGPLSDVRGRRQPLIVSLATYTIISLLAAISPSIWPLILLRFIQGVAGSAGIVISRAVSRYLYSSNELTKLFSQ